MGEVSAEDTRDIMGRVILLLPVKRLAILEYPVDTRGRGRRGEGNTHSWRSLEDRLELAHTLVGTVDTERTFYFGGYVGAGTRQGVPSKRSTNESPEKCSHSPFSFKNKPLCPMYMSTFFFGGRKGTMDRRRKGGSGK